MKAWVNKLYLKLVHDLNAEASSCWCGQIYYWSTFLDSSLPDVLSFLLEKLWLDGWLGEMNHFTFKILDILSKKMWWFLKTGNLSLVIIYDHLWIFSIFLYIFFFSSVSLCKSNVDFFWLSTIFLLIFFSVDKEETNDILNLCFYWERVASSGGKSCWFLRYVALIFHFSIQENFMVFDFAQMS